MEDRAKKLLFDVLASGRSIRHRIIHGYDAIDDAAVWGVVESHLPRLIAEVETLLMEAGESI